MMLTPKSRSNFITAIVVLPVLVMFLSWAFLGSSPGCQEMEAIAHSKEKSEYIKNWVDIHIRNGKILEYTAPLGIIHTQGTPSAFEKINFQWDSIGIDSGNAFISIETGGSTQASKENTIYAVHIGAGRSNIVVLNSIDDEEGNSFIDSINNDPQYKNVSPGIYVYCRAD